MKKVFIIFMFTDLIQPIKLPSGADLNRDFVGMWAVAAGYGIIDTGKYFCMLEG